MSCIRPRPRCREVVLRDLYAERHRLGQLRKLAGNFAAYDVRPVFVHPGTLELTYTRKFALPVDLQSALDHTSARVYALTEELMSC